MPRTRIIVVGASSKKAGKSTVAARLVKELGAEYGLKVSSGGSTSLEPVTTDPRIISTPGTDTGALAEAGASTVIWVNASGPELASELPRALSMFPPGGLLVIEGNSALEYVDPDFTIFVMNVPFEAFKPSALSALGKADLVMINREDELSILDTVQLETGVRKYAPEAGVIVFNRESGGLEGAMPETIRRAKAALDKT